MTVGWRQPIEIEVSRSRPILLILLTSLIGLWITRRSYDSLYDKLEAAAALAWVLWTQEHHLNERSFACGVPLACSLTLAGGSLVISLYIFNLVYDRSLFGPVGDATKQDVVGEVSSKTQKSSRSARFKPLVFPCKTTHTRLFPKKHSFSYSYLLVGFPIGVARSEYIGEYGRSSAQLSKSNRSPKAWFNVRAEDYLGRGNSERGFRGKLDAYLLDNVRVETCIAIERNADCPKDEEPADYPSVYLVTAPRFLGYSFNPVSFWYLYDSRQELRLMILEVNNTFDERRMYVLRYGNTSVCDDNESMPGEGSEPDIFTDTWNKDFHVSPFNSRKGTYSLKAIDPFNPKKNKDPLISNVITLMSSKDHSKLVASINSTSPSIDPDKLGVSGRLHFLVSWWWVGFVTYPRIVKEAGKLFFKRKLHVWFRPEVLPTSIGRRPNSYEE